MKCTKEPNEVVTAWNKDENAVSLAIICVNKNNKIK